MNTIYTIDKDDVFKMIEENMEIFVFSMDTNKTYDIDNLELKLIKEYVFNDQYIFFTVCNIKEKEGKKYEK